jgi:serine protease Do
MRTRLHLHGLGVEIPAQMADVQQLSYRQTGGMNVSKTELNGLSEAVVELVSRTVRGVVALKAAPYRVVSGISLRADLIATADHTLRRQDRVPLETADGTQGLATVLGRDPRVDVAILRVEGLKLTPLEAKDPASLKPGMLAAVVGLTIDAGPSASLGILGAVSGSRRTWRGGILDHFFRLDVNVYPSQVGAAVVDSDGGLIGLATPGLLRHSSVAVPVSTLNRTAEELLQQGRIRQGYLGVGLQAVPIPAALQEKIGGQESGLIVLSVEPGSPAEKAHLQLGDTLISLAAKPLSDVDDLQNALHGDTVGQTFKLALLRGGEPVETQITISERSQRRQ